MTTPTVEKILEDPCASFWLKEALRKALERDPVDASNDAYILLAVLRQRSENKGWGNAADQRERYGLV